MASAIQSQKQAIKIVNRILDNYMKSQGNIRSHFLMSGKSGTGKSYILEELVKKHGVAFVNINAAQLTREGISGNSLSKSLEALKRLQGKPVIVLLDEFDKLFNGVNGGTGDERSGVQSEILHIISSGTAQLIGDYGHYTEVSTRNVLFVFAGAFLGEERLSPAKLLKMGMFPELLGRVNIHVAIPEIDCNDLIKAMKADPLLGHYFSINAITEIAAQVKIQEAIAEEIEKQYKTNVIGYRLIPRLIHQYFLYDGVFPEYADEAVEDLVAISEEFSKKLDFGV
ncbi:MAG: AAA family ATPase [Shewanella sp.]